MIEHLCDHVVRAWRPTTARGPLREEVRTLVPVLAVPEEPNAAVNRPRAPFGETGPGIAPVGERVIYMEADADVMELDVLELVSGPDAPGTFEVNDIVTAPRGHHLELRCRVWHGTLPTEGS